jgi:pyruvate/2-oxoglutarate dehydrogenase complex dihydrolipoamide acyltransferase (E2) component
MDDKLIAAACDYLEIEPRQVLKSRVDSNELILVVDRGIAGCPKYRLPLARLAEVPEKREKTVILGSPKYQDSLVELAKTSAAPEGGENTAPDEPEPEAEITTTLGDGIKVVVEKVPLEPEPPREPPEFDATPAAIKLAGELGIDLAFVLGTGAGGRIIKRDVEAAYVSDDS